MKGRSVKGLMDLFLFSTSLLVGGYLMLTARDPTTAELEARENHLLPAFSVDEIERIELDSEGRSVTLRREKELSRGFLLGEEGNETADASAVDELLSSLEFATWQRRVPSAEDPAARGFDQPRARLRVLAGPRTYRLLVGHEVPQEPGHLYALVDGPNVEAAQGTIEEGLFLQLQRGKQAFRGRNLFPLARSATKRLLFSSAKESFELSADELGFLVRGPTGPLRADRDLSDLLFYHLSRATVDQFIEPSRAAHLQAKHENLWTLSQFGRSGAEDDALAAKVTWGGTCPYDETQVLARRLAPKAVAGCVPEDALGSLRVEPGELVERSASFLNADEIDHVIVENGDRRLDLIRRDASYFLVSRDQEVESAAGDEFLKVFSEGTWELLEERPQGIQSVGKITIKGQAPSMRAATGEGDQDDRDAGDMVHELVLQLYESREDTLVERLDDGAFLRVPQWFTWAVSGHDEWARDRLLLELAPQRVKNVSITWPDGWSQEMERQGDDFFLKNGGLADRGLVERLLNELSPLRAVRYLTKRKRPNGGTLEVSWTTDEKSQTLWVGSRVRGGYLAWADFVDGTFVLPLSSRENFEVALYDRSKATLSVDALSNLVLQIEDRRYEFRRKMGELTPVGGIAEEELREPLRNALLGLEVAATALRSRENVRSTPALLQVSGKTMTGEQIEMHWGPPTSYRGYPMVPAFLPGDPVVYFITRKSAENLLELL